MTPSLSPSSPPPLLWCWRHPPARGAAGRCIGRTDLPVDPRKAKRLAHRIRQCARRLSLPHAVCVSPLRRARDVGRWLARWGWRVQVEALLAEVDFGRWDGRRWDDIAADEVAVWADDLLHHAPGGGESVATVAQRVRDFVDKDSSTPTSSCTSTSASKSACTSTAPRLIVGHGGWINTLLHVPPGCTAIAAVHWPAPPPHGALRCWPVPKQADCQPRPRPQAIEPRGRPVGPKRGQNVR